MIPLRMNCSKRKPPLHEALIRKEEAGLKIVIAGAAGRMGRAIIREAAATPGVSIAGGLERRGHEVIGEDVGLVAGIDALGVAMEEATERAISRGDALIDFTAPAASLTHARAAALVGVPAVIGATGFSPAEVLEIEALAADIPIVKSGNMSIGATLLAALVRRAAALLDEEFDIEILEAHHRKKADAPSGTALLLGRAAAEGRGVALDDAAVRVRDGATGERPPGAIGFAVIRGGGIIGDHEVIFAGAEEILTLSHRALGRGLFAKGALAAAKWAADKAPGLYSMMDVLDLKR